MKMQQIMLREFSGHLIRQNHLTKMFNANDLARLFPEKNLSHWMQNDSTKMKIAVIMERENLTEKQVLFRSGKKKGEERGTWLHPVLAVDLAMWLSPDFWYDVIKWVWDSLCEFRNNAGDNHRLMCDAIYDVLKPVDGFVYADETMMVQDLAGIKVGDRNSATEEQLKKLNSLQRWNANLLKAGILNKVTRRAKLIEFSIMEGK
jgi:hypothetical protein